MNVPKPQRSFRITPNIAIFIICLVVSAVFTLVVELTTDPIDRVRGRITDKTEIAALNSEFEKFVGEGHNLSGCPYFKLAASQGEELAFGQGPLYVVRGYQVVVGQTGTIGAVAYGTFEGRKLILSAEPQVGSEICIMVIDGYTAPQAWWNRPAFSSVIYNTLRKGDIVVPEFCVLMSWSDGMDFDSPPLMEYYEGPYWYWDGANYVRSDAATLPAV